MSPSTAFWIDVTLFHQKSLPSVCILQRQAKASLKRSSILVLPLFDLNTFYWLSTAPQQRSNPLRGPYFLAACAQCAEAANSCQTHLLSLSEIPAACAQPSLYRKQAATSSPHHPSTPVTWAALYRPLVLCPAPCSTSEGTPKLPGVP